MTPFGFMEKPTVPITNDTLYHVQATGKPESPTSGNGASGGSDKLLALPTETVDDKPEAEIAKKGGMAGAIARTFVVSATSPDRPNQSHSGAAGPLA